MSRHIHSVHQTLTILTTLNRSCVLDPPFAQPALTRVSRSLRTETLEIFYRQNSFYVEELHRGDQPPLWISTLKPKLREFLTCVQISSYEPGLAIAVMRMYGMEAVEVHEGRNRNSISFLVFKGKEKQERKRRAKWSPKKKEPRERLDVVDESEEILQEEMGEMGDTKESRAVRGDGSSDTRPTVGTSILDLGPGDCEKEKVVDNSSTNETAYSDKALAAENEQPMQRRRPAERLDPPVDRSSRRKMVVMNGDLTGTQANEKVNVTSAMAQFNELLEIPERISSANWRASEADRSLSHNDLTALERYYVPRYHVHEAVPEQRRELLRKTSWKRDIGAALPASGPDQATSPTPASPQKQRSECDREDSLPSRVLKRMSFGSAEKFSFETTSTHSRKSSRLSVRRHEDQEGGKKLGRSMSSGLLSFFTSKNKK